nr:AAA family ATPase [Deinococcus aestuarii]
MHGYMGSGKTTLARRLEHELPALRFTIDEWIVALYGPDLNAEEFPVASRRVTAVLEGQWKRAVTLGIHVILDYGFWTRRGRDGLRAEASALGVPLTFYALELPEEEAWRRIRRRNLEPGVLPIADETFTRLRPRFEPLGPDETALQVSFE